MGLKSIRSVLLDDELKDFEEMLKDTGAKKSPFIRMQINKAVAEWKKKKGEGK